MLDKAKIIVHDSLGDPQYKIRKLVLRTEIAREAQPGQFVHVQVGKGLDPLLRRPISIADINRERVEITLLYRLKGKGTELLAERPIGEELSVMGPIGSGFTLPDQGELILVAGGIGVFPLLPLAKTAKAKGLSVSLYWGGENEGFFRSAGLKSWQEAGIPVFFSSLDGSIGEKGNVLELIKKSLEFRKPQGTQDSQVPLIQKDPVPGTPPAVAICGPNVMMKVVSEYFLEAGASVEVSLEERMGCAVGACLGCICTLKEEASDRIYRAKVCKDGPVFKGKEVLWDYER